MRNTILFISAIALVGTSSTTTYSGLSFTDQTGSAERSEVSQAIRNDFDEHNAWGLHTTIDLKGCDSKFIRDRKHLKDCFISLCDLIHMKRFGEPWIVHFGECEDVAGFTGIQLIETSDITCHLANKTNNGYFDVFSCKWYDPFVVADFLKDWFHANSYVITIIQRK